MPLTNLDPQAVTRIAAQFNIPPTILLALAEHGDTAGRGPMGISSNRAALTGAPATISAAGGDPTQVIVAAAQMLSQDFSSYGDWKEALSAYLSDGNPNAYKDATGTVGGSVYAILGIAAQDPTRGMGSYVPSSALGFMRSASAFGDALDELSGVGGVVSKHTTQAWRQAASYASGAALPIRGSSSGTSSFNFRLESLPFDPQYAAAGAISEDYGDRSGPGGYAEQGNDYAMVHAPVKAPISGTVKVVDMGHGGTGLTVYITSPGVPGKFYIGHMGSLSVKDGDTVTGGQHLGISGGTASDPSPGNSTGGHIEFGYIDASGVTHDPRPLIVGAYQDDFAKSTLQSMGMPVTPTNVTVLRTMMQGEGMDPGTNNPMATTQPGGRSINSVGVQAYGSFSQGVAATARTLGNGMYPSLAAGLQQGQGLDYFLQPSVSEELRRWQGGSNEDVSLLANAQVSAAPKPPGPDPLSVQSFAQQLKEANISPGQFASQYPQFAATHRQLLGTNPQVGDYAQAVAALQGEGTAPTDAALTDWLREQPHPRYPQIPAGVYHDIQGLATLASVPAQQRVPTPFEVSKLGVAVNRYGAKYGDVIDYFSNPPRPHDPEAQAPSTASPAQPPEPDQRPDRQGGAR